MMMQAPSSPGEWIEVLRPMSRSDRASYFAGERDPESALIAIADSVVSDLGSEATQGIELLDLLVRIADDLDLPHARARIRRSACRALAYVGRFDDSISMARAAIEIAESSHDWSEAGRARLASMHGLCELGRLAEAVNTGHAARQVLERTKNPQLVARADINLGIAHHRNDQPRLAVECFDRARKPLETEPLMIASLENSRGEALLALNDFAGAADAFASARDGFEAAGHSLNAAIAEGNLADLEYRRGRLERALSLFERARRRLASDDFAVHRARLVSELAEAKSVLGLLDEAVAEYQHVIPDLERHGLALEAARARAGLGEALVRTNQLDQAMTMLSAAAAQYQDLGHETARARVDLKRAQLMLAMGHHDRAGALVSRASGVLHDRPADAAMARYVAALIAVEQGAGRMADAEASAGLALIADIGLAPLEADLLAIKARAQHLLGDTEAAIDILREAVRRIERVRGMLQADRFRMAFLGSRTQPYEHLIELLLREASDDTISEAFGVIERVKSRTLLDRMGGVFATRQASRLDDPDVHQSLMIEKAEALRERLNVLYSRLADGTAPREARSAVTEAERELQLLESRLEATHDLSNLRAPTRSLVDVQRLLSRHEVLIEYFATGDNIGALVIRADRATAYQNLCSSQMLGDALQQVQFQMNRALRPGLSESRRDRLVGDARSVLHALSQHIFEPLQIREAKRLVIVPHGAAHMIPFAALWDGKQYLTERFEITTAPSASTWHSLATQESRAGRTFLVVGCGDETAPTIEDEARLLAELCGGRLLVGADATSGALQAEAPNARFLHIATHGRFAGTGQGSGLKLADRWFTLRDLAALRLDADMVVLSGCETGLGSVQRGDEVQGIVRALLAAGGRAVVASLWRVEDSAAAGFMQGLYTRLQSGFAGGLAVSSLIRDVQAKMIKTGQHPAMWAPFFLVGR